MSYECKCRTCKKKLLDDEDNPIYVVSDDEYYCNQECLDKQKDKENEK